MKIIYHNLIVSSYLVSVVGLHLENQEINSNLEHDD